MGDYDVIVVGSGSGGLTAALALARAGRRVAVCQTIRTYSAEDPTSWTRASSPAAVA